MDYDARDRHENEKRASTRAERTISGTDDPRISTNTEETIPTEGRSDAATVHNSQGNPIQEMLITEGCLNSFGHQIEINFVLHS